MNIRTLKATTAALILVGFSSVAEARTKKAQGIMVDFTGTQNLAIVQNTSYSFDKAAAASYFNNEYTGVSFSCVGALSGCTISNRPPQPDIPEVSASAAEAFAESLKCIFLDGGNLVSSSTYSTPVTLPGVNGSGSWTYSFQYSISPAVASVSALTAWNSIASGGTMVSTSIGANIASQAVIQSGNKRKYLFTLDRNNGTPRIRNLKLFLNGIQIASPTATVFRNCQNCLPGQNGAVDFNFVPNAKQSGSVALIKSGDARTILNTDDILTNDDGGSNGRALEIGQTSQTQVSLGVGNYSVTLKGRVMGVDVIADEDFAVSESVSVVAEGCSL